MSNASSTCAQSSGVSVRLPDYDLPAPMPDECVLHMHPVNDYPLHPRKHKSTKSSTFAVARAITVSDAP